MQTAIPFAQLLETQTARREAHHPCSSLRDAQQSCKRSPQQHAKDNHIHVLPQQLCLHTIHVFSSRNSHSEMKAYTNIQLGITAHRYLCQRQHSDCLNVGRFDFVWGHGFHPPTQKKMSNPMSFFQPKRMPQVQDICCKPIFCKHGAGLLARQVRVNLVEYKSRYRFYS